MNNYNIFLKLLNDNKIYEQIALEKVIKLNNVSLLKTCDNYKYDFKTSDNLKYEVKADHKCNITGNFFIEFNGYNKPSGISTTKANYYILTDTTIYYLIDVSILKHICKNKRIAKTPDNSAVGFLISKFLIINNSIVI